MTHVDLEAVIEREMAATPAEFAHGLRLAFGEAVSGGPLKFQVSHQHATLDIELIPGPQRRIAALSLPSLSVRLQFTAGEIDARAGLLKRMDLAMQRGGG